MSGIFKEVDAALRKERMAWLWKRYRVHFILAVTLFLGAIGSYNLWSWKMVQNQEQTAEAFFNATSFGGAKENIDQLLKFSEEGGAIGLPSSFTLASLYLEQGKIKDAQAVLEKIIRDSNTPLLYRDLASIRQSLFLQKENPEKALAILTDLRKRDRPFEELALYLSALLHLRLDKNPAEAILWLETIRANREKAELPDNFNQHVQRVLDVLRHTQK